jgi:hypothetical protein
VSDGLTVRHCPTERMLADFFTKPLQGNLFREFRDIILGYRHTSTLTDMSPSPREERVGINKNHELREKSMHDTESIPLEDQKLIMDTWSVVTRKIKYKKEPFTATEKRNTSYETNIVKKERSKSNLIK